MGDWPTGTVTFLFTDVEGSTRLWEQAPLAMRESLTRHDVLVEGSVTANEGRVVHPRGEGDSRFAVFGRATDAVAAARDLQQALFAEAWTTPRPVRVRIALHTGQAELRDDDYYGSDVNRCARLRAIASGGQTLMSQVTFDLIRDALPAQVTVRDLGEHRLKDLQRAEHVFELDVMGLPADFTPLQSIDAFPNNLPVQLSTFVGRDKELAEVKPLLLANHLLTLAGAGGTGKTRLGLQVAADVMPSYPDGVWFIDLAPVSDPKLIAQTAAAVLGVREQTGHPLLEPLIDYLHTRSTLLILDNCEHLVEACAQFGDSLLRACPKLHILASSRESLGIAGEAVYRVPSLGAPSLESLPPLETLARLDAVRLFVERAAAARPSLTLNAHNASAIAQICRQLDGIPLAIELAASRVKVLSVEQIATRLDNRFQLLTGGSRTALPRQQTLRAAIDWSYSLLSEPERILLRRLAVFVGGWSVEAAEEVCGGNGIEPGEVLDLLSRLVDKSLILTEELAGENRYSRLETIRQYSREKFAETDEVERIRDRHLEYYVRFAAIANDRMMTRERLAWTVRLEAEQDNLRAALEWGLPRHVESALSLVGDLNAFWASGGYAAEAYRWTRQALDRAESSSAPDRGDNQSLFWLKAKALRALAWLYVSLGDPESAQLPAEQSLAMYRQDEKADRRGLIMALQTRASTLGVLGEHDAAEKLLKESLVLAREAGETALVTWGLRLLGESSVITEDNLEAAQAYTEEGSRLARAAGLDYMLAVITLTSGDIAAR
ncbi:MAG TPA: adenylate/guanylate cyclase domain-containing protein, partial [Anaerolineae bacterium]